MSLQSISQSQRFAGRRCPDHKTIKLLVDNLKRYDFFIEPNINRSKPVRNDNNINEVVAAANENPHTSISAISARTNISSTYHAYKMALIQQVRQGDYELRLNFIAQMSVLNEIYNFPYKIL